MIGINIIIIVWNISKNEKSKTAWENTRNPPDKGIVEIRNHPSKIFPGGFI